MQRNFGPGGDRAPVATWPPRWPRLKSAALCRFEAALAAVELTTTSMEVARGGEP
ncbi:hypothetical protein IQ273_01705 [Nodosilinea sp. LEGE 07298]|uniref:hypothetical protein n=1 Tax=Nodosilinea sp. LEGE 07298 TaxID=2777970 RepID=UPI00187E39D0|nr:hypothetical protein [Nodosilinea sp. LEGE 07298]MBE9108138.1 hypothetical protein [Nodosilinea sp. LEGE 07298]